MTVFCVLNTHSLSPEVRVLCSVYFKYKRNQEVRGVQGVVTTFTTYTMTRVSSKHNVDSSVISKFFYTVIRRPFEQIETRPPSVIKTIRPILVWTVDRISLLIRDGRFRKTIYL